MKCLGPRTHKRAPGGGPRGRIEIFWAENRLAILSYLSLTMVYGIRFMAPGSIIYGSDLVLNGIPEDTFTNEMFHSGKLPFWNPYIMGGFPHLASMNPVIFYPTYFVCHLLNVNPATCCLLDYLLCLFVGGLFMYLFMKELGLSKVASILGGLFFMFSGNLATLVNAGHMNNVESIAMIPVIFFFIECGIKKESLFYFLAAGIGLGMQFLAIGFQIAAYTVISAAIYVFCQAWPINKNRKIFFYFVVMVISGPLFSGVQFVPSLFYAVFSGRASVSWDFFTGWSYHPLEMITYLLPRFYGFITPYYWGHSLMWLTSEYIGILPIALAFIAVLFSGDRRRVWFFSIFAVVALILAFGKYTPVYSVLYHLPIINGFRTPARWLVFFTFSVVVLAGFGFDSLSGIYSKLAEQQPCRGFERFRNAIVILAMASFSAWACFFLFPDEMGRWIGRWEGIQSTFAHQPAFLKNASEVIDEYIRGDLFRLFLVLSLIFAVLKFKPLRRRVLISFALIYLIDILSINFQIVHTIPASQNDPDRSEMTSFFSSDKSLYRIFPFDEASRKNWFMVEKIQSIGGEHGVPLGNFQWAIGGSGKLYMSLGFLSLFNAKYIVAPNYLKNDRLKMVHDGNLKIYQNMGVLPRAFLYSKVTIFDNKDEIYKNIMRTDFNPTEALFLQRPFEEPLDNVVIRGDEAHVDKFDTDRLDISVDSPGNAMLFISEVYYPEWEAFVDGKREKIYESFGIFRAVHVEKGKHHVTLVYSRRSFYLGLLISGLAFLAFFIVGFRAVFSEKSGI